MDKSLNDVMLDLETVGQGSKAAIVSIGAVLFNPMTGETGAEFYQAVNLNSSAHYGDIDASTIRWWMKQSKEAQAVFNEDNLMTLKTTLEAFDAWLRDNTNRDPKYGNSTANIWGNGVDFDNVILSNAYKAVGMKQPWAFFNQSDVRTLVELGKKLRNIDPKNTLEREGTAHNALDDARFQVKYVHAIHEALAN